MTKKDPCKQFACRIQDCLERNHFQESACKEVFEDMRNCCLKWGDISFVCEGFKTDNSKQVTNEKEKNKQVLQ